jgi:hypothetical protein
MSADSFFKFPSYDSTSDEDEVQQHSSSREASREYMDPNLIPDRSSDIEVEDTKEEYNKEKEDEDEHEDDDDEPEDDNNNGPPPKRPRQPSSSL